MRPNKKEYIPLLEDYIEEKKISNLDDNVIYDPHANLPVIEPNNQNNEEKVAIFKNDESIFNNKSASSVSVPGQNISFLFYYSVFFSLTVSLIISILLKTQRYINIDSNFPRRVYLESFFLGNFSYANQSFNDENAPINAFSNVSQVLIDESIFINTNDSNQVYFRKNAYAEDGISHPLFSLYNNSFEFNQDYGRDLEIYPDVVITGKLKASSISFGPYRIEHNILTNTLTPSGSNSRLLSLTESDIIVTDFLIKDEYLIVVGTNQILVFYIDQKQIKSAFRPKLIYRKSYYEKEKIIQINASPARNIFTFLFNDNYKDETASIECINKQCKEIKYTNENNEFFSSEIFNKFGAKVELHEDKNKKCYLRFCFNDIKDCSEISIQTDDIPVGCGLAKEGVNEEGNAYVVIPEKKIVRIFEDMNDETAYTDEPLKIATRAKYQPIQMSSYILALNEGTLEVFSF